MEPSDNVFCEIPDVKRDDQHLPLLVKMNALMIEYTLRSTFPIAQKNERPEGEAYIAFSDKPIGINSKRAKLNHSASKLQ